MWSCLFFKSVEGGGGDTGGSWGSLEHRIFEEFGNFQYLWNWVICAAADTRILIFRDTLYLFTSHSILKTTETMIRTNIIIILIKMDLMWRPENQPVDDVEQDKSWREKHSWDTILIIFYHYYYDNIIIIYTYYAYCALSAFLHDLFCVFHPTCWRRRS